MRRIFQLMVCLILFAAPAWAATRYVTTVACTNNYQVSTNTCSGSSVQTSSYTTIAAALSASGASDTIRFRGAGSPYAITAPIFPKAQQIWESCHIPTCATDEAVTIAASGQNYIFNFDNSGDGAANIWIQRLILSGSVLSTIKADKVTGLHLSQLTITGWGSGAAASGATAYQHAIELGGTTTPQMTGVVVEQNTIHDDGQVSPVSPELSGIYLGAGVSGAIIQQNTIYNTEHGIRLDNGSGAVSAGLLANQLIGNVVHDITRVCYYAETRSSVVAEQNVGYLCGFGGIRLRPGNPIGAVGMQGHRWYNNTIYNTALPALWIPHECTAAAVPNASCTGSEVFTDAVFQNNIFMSNSSAPTVNVAEPYHSDATVIFRNNLVLNQNASNLAVCWGDNDGDFSSACSSPGVTYASSEAGIDAWNAAATNVIYAQHMVLTSWFLPLFANAAAGDFRPCTSSGQPVAGCAGPSPALNAGTMLPPTFNGGTYFFTLPPVGTSHLGAQTTQVQTPSTLGWWPIPRSNFYSFTEDFDLCTDNAEIISAGNGCKSIIDNWNSSIFDSRRNRLILWGGGHQGYFGNEMYALDLTNLTTARVNEPGIPSNVANFSTTICPEAIAGGMQPNSRHTYDGIAYITHKDQMFVVGGALACGLPQPRQTDFWIYDFPTSSWTQKSPTGTLPPFNAAVQKHHSAYDPNTGHVFFHDLRCLYEYDPDNGAQGNITRHFYPGQTHCDSNLPGGGDMGYQTAVIDPVRKHYWMIGSNLVYRISIAPGSDHAVDFLTTTGNTTVVTHPIGYPGVTYDPRQDRIIGWVDGSNVYDLNLDSLVWTAHTYTGGPPTPDVQNGTYKRFVYSPTLQAFVVMTEMYTPAYILRMNAFVTDSTSDFLARCAAPGVVYCQGFDHPPDFPVHVRFPDSPVPGQRVTTEKASGESSLMLTIPAGCNSANCSGDWTFYPLNPYGNGRGYGGVSFGAGSTFYFQFRQKVSPSMLTNFDGTHWMAINNSPTPPNSTSWKQLGIYHSGGSGVNCGDPDIKLVRYRDADNPQNMPQMYTNCGVPINLVLDEAWGAENYIQQGDYSNCYHSAFLASECLNYLPNTWTTFYIKTSVGVLDTATSQVDAWLQFPGERYRHYVHSPTQLIQSRNAPDNQFDNFFLTAYMTSNETGTIVPALVDAFTWFDEVVISTQPIAAPAGIAVASATPKAPTNLRVTGP